MDELGAAVAAVAAIRHAIERGIPGRPERALRRELHAVDQPPLVRQAERDGVAPHHLGHDGRAAAARRRVGCQRREMRERRGAEHHRRQRERRRGAGAEQDAGDRDRREHERGRSRQEAPLEAALALVRPRLPARASRCRPRDDDGERLRLRGHGHDPRRSDLRSSARGDANPLASNDRKLLGSRVATTTCLDSGHVFILVGPRANDPGPTRHDQGLAPNVRGQAPFVR